jgi:hypothetical protein
MDDLRQRLSELETLQSDTIKRHEDELSPIRDEIRKLKIEVYADTVKLVLQSLASGIDVGKKYLHEGDGYYYIGDTEYWFGDQHPFTDVDFRDMEQIGFIEDVETSHDEKYAITEAGRQWLTARSVA